ncbi:UDP-N-acetylmuramoyl-tripeptide--D-alanyl-D-alanine ligase [Hymenobacter busanensis]|uniref:UDP-N-acetylmuramoyl-tripeptide--D-alanyl-D-alanine ligase n=1 Tax=Hymenobacter busanensis TaxID=2607656 RepID=A0A7L5A0E0_9BACT|nr:UDP-N-acetylmuramoyl-tripeptide--D-alanyl-D-alanine ligase [Hymenobacter busanensis]KAA9333445.1 UDP-N-acetylmuramoyl-tripeptide--D-alanyl-D-alanine ligase [Hymenobacter busanensis]QHJ07872.1 UDP-N-acetylmuramoyl-tripeptide--D-alanyl-D-alanine ligase [Hymenobacter busanensis]
MSLPYLPELYARFRQCGAVSTDSRQPQQDTLFVALNGPSFRGAAFAPQALAQGARFAVVDDAAVAAQDPARYVLVPDTLEALQQLALYHRRQLTMPVVAITGSNGKTTTKELVHAVLGRRYRVQYTRGNLNNHIGVPLTLLSIDSAQHDLAVVEMGANHQGEIALLCRLAEPTHGLITNIGKAHLEGFGGVEGVAKGKGEMLQYLAASGGTAFVNTADTRIPALAAAVAQRISYPNPGDTYPATLLAATPHVSLELFDGTPVQARITGAYNFLNLAAAAAVGAHFEVPAEDIAAGLAGYDPVNNRSQLVRTAHNEVVLDAYNANPSSMAAAIASLAARPGDNARKAVLLADMFELGNESTAEHHALGDLLARQHFGTVLLIGPEMQRAQRPGFHHFATKAQAAAWLREHPLRDQQVLVKGSRGMSLETLMELL